MTVNNEKYKKRQFLSAQVDLSKFNDTDFIPATDEEKAQQEVMGESTTFLKDGLRRLRKNNWPWPRLWSFWPSS